jgi:hypothetical protein
MQVRRGEDIGPGREKLAELDEGRPHALQVVGELGGLGNRPGRDLALVVQAGVETGSLHQVQPPILEKQERYVLVAPEMLRFQREAHDRERQGAVRVSDARPPRPGLARLA